MGRVSRSWAASDVAATAASSWILVIVAAFWPGILASAAFWSGILSVATVGTSSWRASPTVGMPPWTTPMPQPQRPSSLPPMVSHFCLFSIVSFVIRANVKQLAYSSIMSASILLHRPDTTSSMGFQTWEDPARVRAMAVAPATTWRCIGVVLCDVSVICMYPVLEAAKIGVI
jgi:hypothetical protein